MMCAAQAVVTVGVVSGDSPTDRPPSPSPSLSPSPAPSPSAAPPPAPARVAEWRWLVTSVLTACAAWAVLAVMSGPGPFARAPRLIFVFLLCSLIIVLRRWPLPVLGVAALISGLAVASGPASLAVVILLGLASYLVASSLPRKASIYAALATAAGLGVALGYHALAGRGGSLPSDGVLGFAPLAAGWFVGDAVATRRRYLAGLAEQAERERAAEAERARQEVREERVRIARELHDVVAHTLAVITVQAGVGRRLMAKRPEEAALALDSIETIGRTAQDELRVVLALLRDESIGPAALTPAPRLVDIKELVHNVQASGTPVELRASDACRELSPALELSIYRVVQEALTNVVKHAPGASATVDLAVSDRGVRIEVTDDGGPPRPPGDVGPPSGAAGPDLRHGIVGMRERTGAFGGWLVAEPLPGRGFHVLAEIPLEGAAGPSPFWSSTTRSCSAPRSRR
jgi:signal transduction histidine kinase